jgi:Protein of unknown function (DUF4239)
MARSILALPTWLIDVLLVIVFPALVLGVQWGIRRRWPALARGEHNEVVGAITAGVGVIYAVLLGFVVIVAWEHFDEAEQVVAQEASALTSIYRENVAFPRRHRPTCTTWSGSTRRRGTTEERPAMAPGQPGDPRVGGILDQMAAEISRPPSRPPRSRSSSARKPIGPAGPPLAAARATGVSPARYAGRVAE